MGQQYISSMQKPEQRRHAVSTKVSRLWEYSDKLNAAVKFVRQLIRHEKYCSVMLLEN
jgi:hypothetical protein